MPHLHGTVVALVAPGTSHCPSETITDESGVDEEGREVDRLGRIIAACCYVVGMEACLLDRKDLQTCDVVASLVASNLLAFDIAVSRCPQAEPIARIFTILYGPSAIGVSKEEARPFTSQRLIVSAQLVGAVPFCLQQEAVVVDIAQAEGIAIRLNGKYFAKVGQRIHWSLEEESLIAVFGSIFQAHEQVGLITGNDEIVVGRHTAQFLCR